MRFSILLILAFNLFATQRLSLKKAKELALKNSPEYLACGEELNSSKGDLIQARSGFFPQLNANAGYTYITPINTITMPVFTIDSITHQPRIDTVTMEFGQHNNYSVGLSLQQPIFTWGRLWNSYNLARINLDIQKLNLQRKEMEIEERVTEAYYNALVAERFLALSKEMREELEKHFKSVKDKYSTGYASKLELMRAEVKYKNAEPRVLEAENLYKTTLNSLKLLLGLPQEEELELTDSLEYTPYEVSLDTLLKRAFEKRKDLRIMEKRIELAKRALSIAKSSNKPSLFSQVNYSYRRPIGFEDKWGGSWNLSLGISLPLFTGFKNRGAVISAKSRLKQIELLYKLKKDATIMEINSLYNSLETSRKSLESQKENVELAEETFRMAEEQYRQGFASSLDVMDIELAYYQARVNYLNALKNYNISLAKLKFAIEGGRL